MDISYTNSPPGIAIRLLLNEPEYEFLLSSVGAAVSICMHKYDYSASKNWQWSESFSDFLKTRPPVSSGAKFYLEPIFPFFERCLNTEQKSDRGVNCNEIERGFANFTVQFEQHSKPIYVFGHQIPICNIQTPPEMTITGGQELVRGFYVAMEIARAVDLYGTIAYAWLFTYDEIKDRMGIFSRWGKKKERVSGFYRQISESMLQMIKNFPRMLEFGDVGECLMEFCTKSGLTVPEIEMDERFKGTVDLI